MEKITLISDLDLSKNYVISKDDEGFLESRYVQRDPSYFIVYLSSHTGCNQACRMCHLTQSKQVMMTPATMEDYLVQAKNVLSEVDLDQLKNNGLKRIKFSFMARGEPLLNPTVINDWDELRRNLRSLIPGYFDVEFNISTIYPSSFKGSLSDVFKTADTTIYYSIYSINPKFRKRWLGNSTDVPQVIQDLNNSLTNTDVSVKFHSAFIKDHNDDLKDVNAMYNYLYDNFIGVINFNIVRYNPHSSFNSTETSLYRLKEIRDILHANVKTRVGMDVQASCGMFYES